MRTEVKIEVKDFKGARAAYFDRNHYIGNDFGKMALKMLNMSPKEWTTKPIFELIDNEKAKLKKRHIPEYIINQIAFEEVLKKLMKNQPEHYKIIKFKDVGSKADKDYYCLAISKFADMMGLSFMIKFQL
jgi:hypothetical protein